MLPVSLTAKNIGKRFRSGRKDREASVVLQGVSFSIIRGETFGIMGGSGTGKTTLARILAGLEPVSFGRLKYRDRDVQSLGGAEKKRFRQKVQMVFQNPEGSLNPRKVLGLMGQPHEAGEDLIRDRLEQVGLSTEVLGRLPSQLSGGQNQRVALARVLLLEPEFLILDEPTSALDISARAQLLHLLKSLQRSQNLGYAFISHEPEIIRFMAHRVGVIRDRTLHLQ
jgi:peptide/nickel transport system ATP-binding protein